MRKGHAMGAAFASVKNAKTILLATYKRDGTAVGTPVSIAFDGERAFFRSYDKAWKTRRLHRNSRVQVAPSTFRGKPTGPAVQARATLLEGEQAGIAARALARRHRVLQAVVVPAAHRLMRYRTMHYELRPDPRRAADPELPPPAGAPGPAGVPAGPSRIRTAGSSAARCDRGLDIIEESLKDQVMKRLDPLTPDRLVPPAHPAVDDVAENRPAR